MTPGDMAVPSATPPAVADVIDGLSTASDKIRALGRAGYSRVDIAKALGVRYQQVRAVLLAAGITGGLRKPRASQAINTPVEPPVALHTTSWEVLLRAGFQMLGEWTQGPEGAIHLDAQAPTKPGVYAFVLNDGVVYVGLASLSLRARLDGYRRGQAGQRTNVRVKRRIAESLAQRLRVKVLIAMPTPTEWCGLPVNTAAGLEAGLIRKFRPAWNIKGVA